MTNFKNMKCSKRYKIAFLGGGVNSAIGMSHFVGSRMDGKFEVVAGCFSSNKEVNLLSADKYFVPRNRCYKNLEELIYNENNNIDAIVVLTPINQHHDQLLKIIEYKIPVICEKSLTQSLDEAVAVRDVVGDNFLAVVYNYLCYPMVKEMKGIINSGELGVVKNIQVEMPSQTYIKLNDDDTFNNPQGWRMSDGKIPTISLDLGTHLHSLTRYIAQAVPEKVIANYNTHGNHKNVIDDVSLIVKCSNNITCNYWFSKSSFGYNNGMKIRIFCEFGSLKWLQENPEFIQLVDRYGSKKIMDRSSVDCSSANLDRYNRFKAGHPIGHMEAFANFYSEIYDSLTSFLENGEVNKTIFSIETAIEGLSMLDSASVSNSKKSWQNVNGYEKDYSDLV